MKVAMFSASASPHMRAYLDALVAAGHAVTLLTTHPDNRDVGVPIIRLASPGPLERRLPMSIRVRIVAARLRREFRRGRYDVLNVQQMTAIGILAASVFEGPQVLTFWGSDLLLPEVQPPWALDMLPAVVRDAAIVHVCSDQMRQAALDLGAKPDRLANFQYGIDLDLFKFGGPVRQTHTAVSTRLLKPLYRVDVLVRAFALVLQRVPDARLTVFGRGGDHDALVALAAELGISGAVDFAGFAPATDLAGAVASAAVWVSLPPSDGAPLSLFEAMAGGALPVVADIPSIHEWVAPGRGVFVRDVTPEGVADGIVEGFRVAAEAEYATPNRRIIEERGDRRRNLPRFARLVEAAASGSAPSPLDL